jgi:enoyl-CoA hydratase/carnithine racemase
MVAAGIATHYVPAERWPAALAALEKIGAGPKAKQEATAALEAFAAPAPGPCLLAEHRAEIDRVFAAATVEEMLAALDAEPGAWAGETAAAMRRASPTSLKVALAALRQGARLDLKAALKVEYRLSQYFMRGPEFFEGVRAAVIDKDRRPRWQPDSLAGVDAAAVDRAFAGGAETELGFE